MTLNSAPNMRMQRTQLLAWRDSEPMTRKPLGGQGGVAVSIALGLVMLIAVDQLGYSSETLSAADARRQLMEKTFKIVTTTAEIPPGAVALLTAMTKTQGVVLAEPGAKYQE